MTKTLSDRLVERDREETCLEIDAAACEQESGRDAFWTAVAWTVGEHDTDDPTVGLGLGIVGCESVLEDEGADFGRDSIGERSGCLGGYFYARFGVEVVHKYGEAD